MAPHTSRRLRALREHLRLPSAAEMPSGALASAAVAATGPAGIPLTERQLQDFLVDGVLLLQISELGPDFHTELYRKIEELQADNEALLAPLRDIKDDAERMKEMRKVFTSSKRRQVVRELPELTDVSRSPTIHGALHSILGPGCKCSRSFASSFEASKTRLYSLHLRLGRVQRAPALRQLVARVRHVCVAPPRRCCCCCCSSAFLLLLLLIALCVGELRAAQEGPTVGAFRLAGQPAGRISCAGHRPAGHRPHGRIRPRPLACRHSLCGLRPRSHGMGQADAGEARLLRVRRQRHRGGDLQRIRSRLLQAVPAVPDPLQ